MTRRERESPAWWGPQGVRAGWEAGGWPAAGWDENTLRGTHLSCPLTFGVNLYLLLTQQSICAICFREECLNRIQAGWLERGSVPAWER